MIELDMKYVLHIPLCKFENDRLVAIEIDAILEDLISDLNRVSFYTSRVESHYKSRKFEELLLTVFVASDCSEPIDAIFKSWFESNNHILQQESFSYECNNCMYIETL